MQRRPEEWLLVLGLEPGCSKAQITQTYRDLVKVWHPDRFSHDPRLQIKAQEQLKEINLAYENLRDYRPGGSATGQEVRSASRDDAETGSHTQGPRRPAPPQGPSRPDSQEPSGPAPLRGRRFPVAVMVVVVALAFAYAVSLSTSTQQVAEPIGQPLAPADTVPNRALNDLNLIEGLKATLDADPRNAAARVRLGNLYFDAERYKDAIPVYEEAIRLSPRDVAVSTDLAVCYYQAGNSQRALNQVNYSLSLDPQNTKALFNRGYFQAFGLEDLSGASASFQRVLQIAPNGPEAEQARRALASMKK